MRTSLYNCCEEHDRTNLLQQRYQEKNGPMPPKQVTHGSNKKIWGLCARAHPWQAMVKSRVGGTGCPVRAGKARASPMERYRAALLQQSPSAARAALEIPKQV